jgi:hypothetical protein
MERPRPCGRFIGGYWAQSEAGIRGGGTGVPLEGRCGNVLLLQGTRLWAAKVIPGTRQSCCYGAQGKKAGGIKADASFTEGVAKLHAHEGWWSEMVSAVPGLGGTIILANAVFTWASRAAATASGKCCSTSAKRRCPRASPWRTLCADAMPKTPDSLVEKKHTV